MHTLAAAVTGMMMVALPCAPQSSGARLTASHDVASPMPFEIPSLKLQGVVRPAAGSRLFVVALALGEEPIDDEVARFLLVAGSGTAYEPVGAGGRPDLIIPLDRLPLDREVGEILPTDVIVSLTRRSATSVALEVGPGGTIAFLYELPADAAVRALRLPDGRELAVAP